MLEINGMESESLVNKIHRKLGIIEAKVFYCILQTSRYEYLITFVGIINLLSVIGTAFRKLLHSITIREDWGGPDGNKSLHTMLRCCKHGVASCRWLRSLFGLDIHLIGVTLNHKHNRNMIIIRCRWALPVLSHKE